AGRVRHEGAGSKGGHGHLAHRPGGTRHRDVSGGRGLVRISPRSAGASRWRFREHTRHDGEGYVRGLLGDKFQLEDELSPARRVDERTSPTFIWATASDPPGLPNALEWARVLGENQIPMELHIYPEGRRGIG